MEINPAGFVKRETIERSIRKFSTNLDNSNHDMFYSFIDSGSRGTGVDTGSLGDPRGTNPANIGSMRITNSEPSPLRKGGKNSEVSAASAIQIEVLSENHKALTKHADDQSSASGANLDEDISSLDHNLASKLIPQTQPQRASMMKAAPMDE